ncbi:MAG: hypothetical protein BM565_02285 [Gammaproteobacteria bacterium MedPE]|nr:MAG: hypothetical protein BM565_02285 [Gammaproteobacteria bacterium MedPE]
MTRLLPIILVGLLLGCNEEPINSIQHAAYHSTQLPPQYPLGQAPAIEYLTTNQVYNPESVIPPQCYTKTEGENNPCYACHQSYPNANKRSNMMSDGGLQGNYEFSDVGSTNNWKNLFVDRTHLIKSITDDNIMQWTATDNYQPFINKMKNNKQWRGEFTPINNLANAQAAFDKLGIANDGSHWIAFNYKPFPSTFWPTNGSTGDAMIRLDKTFRERHGQYSHDVYFANLALVELTVKALKSVTVPPISEITIGDDLNGNGKIDARITRVVARERYVGDATNTSLAPMLYPQGTEFLHTVRYLGVDNNGAIFNAKRMKEVRYMKKHKFKHRNSLKSAYMREDKEKLAESLPKTVYLGDRGIDNGFGWTINAYIEDKQGELRQQHHQELAFCNGCHKTIGSTIDQTFSFPRKIAGAAGWGYINLKNQRDVATLNTDEGEFLTYFKRVGGGDEFRQNQEMLDKWFLANGDVNEEKVKGVDNLYQLIMPSKSRALALNKAYLTIVKEQSYIFGRDATLSKAKNVLQTVNTQQPPLKPEHQYQWDIRLDWPSTLSDNEQGGSK